MATFSQSLLKTLNLNLVNEVKSFRENVILLFKKFNCMTEKIYISINSPAGFKHAILVKNCLKYGNAALEIDSIKYEKYYCNIFVINLFWVLHFIFKIQIYTFEKISSTAILISFDTMFWYMHFQIIITRIILKFCSEMWKRIKIPQYGIRL